MNSVTTASTSSFDLVWALVRGFTPLPVELLMFTAWPENDAVVCEWRTASEVGNDFFTVERSVDGLSFTDIGEEDDQKHPLVKNEDRKSAFLNKNAPMTASY